MVYKFDSVAEYVRHLERAEVNSLFRPESCSSHGTSASRVKFTGSASFPASVDLLRFGDAENYKKVAAYRSNMRGGSDGVRRVQRLSVVGGSPCVGAYLAGHPAAMFDRVRQKFDGGKVVNICVDTTFPWTIDAADIVKCGANILAVVLGMEKKGYQVNLYASCGAYAGGEEVVVLCRIKSAGVHVDAKKLAYPLVNPSFLRRSWFRLVETTPGLKSSRWPRSYGTCMDGEQLKKHVPAGCKFVQLWKHLKKTPDELERFLLAQK